MKRARPLTVSDRRQWMTSVMRHGALAAIATLVTFLVGRQWNKGCPLLTSRCESCRLLSRCALPPAQSARRMHVDKEHS
jgi:hypothetical protein